MRKFFLLGAAVLVASSMSVSPVQAGMGLGYIYQSHPLGLFFDMDGSYVHVGVGFEKNDVPDGSGSLETEIGIAGAWIMDMHAGDNWGFGPSVGVAFTSMSPEGDGDSASMTHISLGLYGHWEPASAISFWMGTGLGIDLNSPPVGDSTTDFGLRGANVADLGFTLWLP